MTDQLTQIQSTRALLKGKIADLELSLGVTEAFPLTSKLLEADEAALAMERKMAGAEVGR